MRKHHQSIVLGTKPLSKLRTGEKFYRMEGEELVGHQRTVASVKHKGRVTTVLCLDGGAIGSTVDITVSLVQDKEN